MMIFVNKYIKKHLSMYFIYLVIVLLLNIISVILPKIQGDILNLLELKSEKIHIIKFITYLLLISVAGTVCKYIYNTLFTCIQTKIGYESNQDLLSHIQKLPYIKLRNMDAIYVSQRINNAVNEVVAFYIENVGQTVITILKICVLIYVLCKINGVFFVMVLLFTIGSLIIYMLFKTPIYKKSLVMQEKQSKFFSALSSELINAQFIKSNNIERIFISKTNSAFKVLFKSLMEWCKCKQGFELSESLLEIGLQIIYFMIGIVEIVNGSISLGTFVIIIEYVEILKNSIVYLYGLCGEYQQANSSYNIIEKVMSEKIEKKGKIKVENIKKISLQSVEFQYEINGQKIIQNFSYDFYKDKIYVLVGKNGVGKTTLIDIISGLYNENYYGKIKINDIDMSEVDVLNYRKNNISFCRQNDILIDGSLIENVELFGNIDDEIKKSEMYKLLYGELSTRIETNNQADTLSYGQKQKITILRSMIKKSEVILMDEPTSALDIGAKKALLSDLTKIKRKKIVILVSHDPFVIQNADEIIDLGSK